ncbi:HamA C-terminal domain-containing protein [Haloarcula nitratireducens]|uniref:DUF1837 domain-containing protein n=1 Tax=Haloarcula nitratireducens TaxID=2487749 RepID=A0AAW4PIM7_9EURY|nr:DUF1837 domain-containing protein [Halomicroarcula nitratireducens]MBX0297659.1 DUF1837 domain-containing protein [Halomicroarcula nitratireducens]
MSGFNWEDATVISQTDLEEYVYVTDSDSVDNLHIKNYCVQISPAGFSFNGLEEFLRNRFVYYVFSEDEIQRLEEQGETPRIKAQEMAGIGKQFRQDGTLGEFILFLLADGFLDLPMISHKISRKQNYSHEVYGCDNLFFGTFDGDECLGIGEAKVYQDLTRGIRQAVSSISEFHEEQSHRYLDQELSVAPRGFSENLNEEQFDYLSNVVSASPDDHPLLHPIFVCYEDQELTDAESVSTSEEEIQSLIETRIADLEPLSKAENQVENGSDRLRRAHLLFLFLPVPDIDQFRKRMLLAIDPGLRHILDEESPESDADQTEEGTA